MEAFNLLTEDEKFEALQAATWKKEAKLKEQAYFEELRKPKPKPVVTTEQLSETIGKKALAEIPGFKLNDTEKAIYKLLSQYFTGNQEFEKTEGFSLKKGLLLFGNIGCGKTTALRLFQANPLQSYVVIPCRQVAYEFTAQKEGGYDAIERYFHMLPSSVPSFSYGQRELGICFDDLGTETTAKHFGNESNVMAEIILNRYDNEHGQGVKTHLSTNLTGEEIEQCYGKRVRSRMREMFNLIEFPKDSQDKRK